MSKSYAEENEYDSVVQNYHHTSTGKEISNADEYCTPLSEPIVPTQNEISYADEYCTPLSEPVVPTNGLRQHKSLNAGTHYQLKNKLGKDDAEIYESSTTIETNRSTNHYFHPPGKMGSKESTGDIYECAIDKYNDRQNDVYAVVDKSRKTSNKPKVKESNKRPPKSPSSNSSKTEACGDSYTSFKNLMNKNDVGIIKRGKVVKWIVYGVIVLLLISVCYLSYVYQELKKSLTTTRQQIHHQKSEFKSALQTVRKQGINDTNLIESKINETTNFVKKALQIEHEQRIYETNLNKLKIKETANFVAEVNSRLQKMISSGVFMRLHLTKIDSHSRAGLIQMWVGGKWYYILSWRHDFHEKEAKVVCRMMGYARGEYRNGKYNKPTVPGYGEVKKLRITCDGDEETILQCSIKPANDGLSLDTIGVLCKL